MWGSVNNNLWKQLGRFIVCVYFLYKELYQIHIKLYQIHVHVFVTPRISLEITSPLPVRQLV